jgi:predicted dehydrogenase/threonine dehydrogenase-like Zn-dependent dehydrogenase
MKQIVQDMQHGNTDLIEVPAPIVADGEILIKSSVSLVSLGTERMLVKFGKSSYLQKAKQQPDKVKQVLDKMRTDGIRPTVETVFNKLSHPLPLGYCNVGVIVEVGFGVKSFKVGDRVVSNGNHAEYVSVPENLIAKIPDSVSDESAAFTVVGAIALEGIRLCNPTFGESIVVIGLGLIGLLTSELLIANGAHVIAYDLDSDKVALAKSMGVDAFKGGGDVVNKVNELTDNIGADAVLITASASGDQIIHDAANMCRKRGRIVLLGVVGLNIRRDDFYAKELTFQVSCSYGPGRYDDDYERKGKDYPLPYVRWTEKRNFEAFLSALDRNQISVDKFISEKFPLEEYERIYNDMERPGNIASLLIYVDHADSQKTILVDPIYSGSSDDSIVIVGAGNFVSSTILPALKKTIANIQYIVSAGGLNASILAKKHNISNASTSFDDVLRDDSINLCIISTRHNLHAAQTVSALRHGKNVFVEKPLCLNVDELEMIIKEQKKSQKMVVVGFNRRFSPLAQKARNLIGDGLININATMNAGHIPPESWVHDQIVGGGRIVGEACHYIDLCSYFTNSMVSAVCMNSLGSSMNEMTDNATILLKYENGSQATINYFANGSRSYAKERVELFSQGRTVIIENWRKLHTYGIKEKGFSGKQQKGHNEQFQLLVERIKNSGAPLIQFSSIINTTRASFAALQSLREQRWVKVDHSA